MNNLLEKAQAVEMDRPAKVMDPDLAQLAVAWAYDEITVTQAAVALGWEKSNAAYAPLARGLRDAVRLGLLVRAKDKTS